MKEIWYLGDMMVRDYSRSFPCNLQIHILGLMHSEEYASLNRNRVSWKLQDIRVIESNLVTLLVNYLFFWSTVH